MLHLELYKYRMSMYKRNLNRIPKLLIVTIMFLVCYMEDTVNFSGIRVLVNTMARYICKFSNE